MSLAPMLPGMPISHAPLPSTGPSSDTNLPFLTITFSIQLLMPSNIVEYDLREIPHASDQPVSGYYPVVAQSMTFTTEGIGMPAKPAP